MEREVEESLGLLSKAGARGRGPGSWGLPTSSLLPWGSKEGYREKRKPTLLQIGPTSNDPELLEDLAGKCADDSGAGSINF